MTLERLRERAPAVLLVVASGVLAAAFSASFGRERGGRTRYAPLSGYAGAFAEGDKSAAGNSSGAAWGLVAEALRRQYPQRHQQVFLLAVAMPLALPHLALGR